MTARSALLREVRVELDKHLHNASAHELVEAADAMVILIEAKLAEAVYRPSSTGGYPGPSGALPRVPDGPGPGNSR